jgi:hypothetical protein
MRAEGPSHHFGLMNRAVGVREIFLFLITGVAGAGNSGAEQVSKLRCSKEGVKTDSKRPFPP